MHQNHHHKILLLSFLLLFVSKVGISMDVDKQAMLFFEETQETEAIVTSFDSPLDGHYPADGPTKKENDPEEGEKEELKEEKREKESDNHPFSFHLGSFPQTSSITIQLFQYYLHNNCTQTVFRNSTLAPFRTQRIFLWCCCFLN